MLQSDNDVLICTKFEIISYDIRIVLLIDQQGALKEAHFDLIIVCPPLLESSKVPYRSSVLSVLSCRFLLTSDHITASRGNDSLLCFAHSSVESLVSNTRLANIPRRGESDGASHVRNMLRSELESSRDRLTIRREAALKTQRSLVSSTPDQRVNEKQIRFTCSHQPSAISRHVQPDDRIAQSRQCSLQSARLLHYVPSHFFL
jgi:hypothetical protein